jgi:ankyrin repeat protein
MLVDKGADVNAVAKDGRTPLHFALINMYGYKRISQMLVDKGADVKAVAKDGWTPLHWAARVGHKEPGDEHIKEIMELKGQMGRRWNSRTRSSSSR